MSFTKNPEISYTLKIRRTLKKYIYSCAVQEKINKWPAIRFGLAIFVLLSLSAFLISSTSFATLLWLIHPRQVKPSRLQETSLAAFDPLQKYFERYHL